MCSELFRIPMEWAGVRLFGFGLLLLIWFLGGLVWLIYSGRRHGWSAETWSPLPMWVMGGAVLALLPQMFPEGLPIRGYGTMVLAGSVLGLWMATSRAQQVGWDPEIVIALAVRMILAGIIGARLFYVIEYWDSRFQFDSAWTTFKEVLNFPQGGLVVYGSFIGATLAFGIFCVRRRLPPLALADLIAPSLVAGLALGRIGCLLNGCCYGGISQQPWAVPFPQDSLPYMEQVNQGLLFGFQFTQQKIPTRTEKGSPVQISSVEPDSQADLGGLEVGDAIIRVGDYRVQNEYEVQAGILRAYQARRDVVLETSSGKTCILQTASLPNFSKKIHPTQAYSAIHAGLLAWFLWSWYPFRKRDGEIFAILITVYPITRYLLEDIRIDESAVFNTGLSISQNISLILLVAAAGLWVVVLRRPLTRTSHS